MPTDGFSTQFLRFPPLSALHLPGLRGAQPAKGKPQRWSALQGDVHSKQDREEEGLERLLDSHKGPTEHTGEACSSESKHGSRHHTSTGQPTSLSELST